MQVPQHEPLQVDEFAQQAPHRKPSCHMNFRSACHTSRWKGVPPVYRQTVDRVKLSGKVPADRIAQSIQTESGFEAESFFPIMEAEEPAMRTS